ncbi:MAG TPA: redoxin domain-containing protein [Holophaga sp.]|nr:redoxin domain-containing protein [Holophaga sp.]
MRRAVLLSLIAAWALPAQEFNFVPVVPGSTYCWREEVDAQKRLAMGPSHTMTDQAIAVDREVRVFPVAERKDGTGFAVVPIKGKPQSLAAYKGKVVVVGVFSAVCDPSIRLLAEMAELQPKGPQFGFEVFPICLDRLTALGQIIRRNQPRFDKTAFFTQGLAEQGLLNLGPELRAAPTTFILDREGRVAMRWVGYHPGVLVNALKAILREPAAPAAPPAASEPPKTEKPAETVS